MKPFQRRWISIAACTVIVMVIAMQLPTNAQSAFTNEDCESAWKGSDAAQSCGATLPNVFGTGYGIDTTYYWVKAVSGGRCQVKVDCAREDNSLAPQSNDVVVSGHAFVILKNCDGTLKAVVSC